MSPPGTEKASGKLLARVDGDDAERDLLSGAGRAGAASRRVRVVDDDVEEGALVHDVGEGPQLVGGTGQLAGQPGHAERGLRVGRRHDLVADVLQRSRRGPQQRRAYAAVGEGGDARRAARTAASTSAAVASIATCSRCFPVRGSTLQTGTATGIPPHFRTGYRESFDILNNVFTCESQGSSTSGPPGRTRGSRRMACCRGGGSQVKSAVRTVELLEFFAGQARHAQPGRRAGIAVGYPKSQPLHAAAHPGRPRLGGDGRHRHPVRHRRARAAGRHLLHRRRRGRGRRPARPWTGCRTTPPRRSTWRGSTAPTSSTSRPGSRSTTCGRSPGSAAGCPRTPPRSARRCWPRTPTSRCARCCRSAGAAHRAHPSPTARS